MAKQQLCRLHALGERQGGLLVIVAQVGIGASVDEPPHALDKAAARREHERCDTMRPTHIEVACDIQAA